MKQKFPFTPVGVNEKVSSLYAEDNAIVEAEAFAVEQNLNLWMEDNFILTSEQLDYMDSLGPVFSEQTGEHLAYAFRHRLPVTLTKGDINSRSYKFIREEQRKSATYTPAVEPIYAESLDYYIS